MLTDKKIISLDVDGTLYDMSAFKKAFVKLIFSQGLLSGLASTAKDLHKIYCFHFYANRARKAPSREKFQRLEKQSIHAELSLTRWYGDSLKCIGPREGIQTFLDLIRQHRIKLVALSDYRCDYKLKALNLETYFDDQIIGETLHHFKPDAEIFHHLLDKYHATTQDVLHIGDKIGRDAKAAKQANIECLIIKHDFQTFFDLCQLCS